MGCFSGGVRLSLLLLCGIFYAECSKGAPDNRGTEFIIGYMENSGTSIDVELFVTTSRTSSVSVTVDAPKCSNPKISSTFKITSGQVKQLFLKPNIRMAGSSKSDKGVRVRASDEIVIYGINKEVYSCDGFIGIPIDVLSDEYYVVSWYPSSYNTAMLVVGVQDSTSVSITISNHIGSGYVDYNRKKYYKGNVVKETLNKYGTWQLVSKGDLTGSYVKSNKPVSVFSGNQRTTIGKGTSSDHLVEQMLPVNTWGKTFATVPIPKRTVGDYFKFTASEDNTKVTISGGYKSTFTISKAGGMVQKLISSKAFCKIVANKPIMVAQFVQSQQSTSELSDPALMIIPPVEQYGADYTFATPKYSRGSYNNYFMFIVEESQKSGLRLDGTSFPSSTKYNKISGTSLVGGYISIAEGSHTVRHTSPIAIFGGFLYGQANFETYGFTTGMRIAKVNAVCVPTPTVVGDGIDNDCDGKIDEELCTPENKNKDDDGDGKINEDCAKPAPIDGKWSAWSAFGACSLTCQASSKKVSGTKLRKRTCTNPAPANDGQQCAGSDSDTASCTPSNACPAMQCYTCSNGKKNSDCTKTEKCKKDEESCETKIRRDKAEISKKCVKTKYCKAKCDKKDKECTLCCTGILCNKNQGYAEFKSWGSWSSCSEKCGGGKRSRTRTCSSTGDVPCSGDTKEEQDCNNQACPIAKSGAPDNRGTQFIIGYMENSGTSIDVELFVTTSRSTSVTVTVDSPKCTNPKISSSFTITAGQVKQLFLKPGIRMAGSSKSNKGVRVQASDEIVIYGINKEVYSCDGFIGIPIDVISDEYYVVSWYPSSYNTALLVVGVQDSTSVSITISNHIGSGYVDYNRKKYYKGNVVKESLNKYETWQLVSKGDLTGSYIKSNKPVSVFSGNQRTTIGKGTSSDHLVEQMLPVNTWGKTFATVPTPKRTVGDYFKFTASVDNTKVTISGGYKSTFTISKAGSMVQKLISSKAYCKIVADKPIMVTQFVLSQQSTSELSDPAMMIIPPVEQYGADYTFATPKYSRGSYSNYFMFIVEESQKSGLLVDGKPFPSSTKYNEIAGTSLVGGYISVSEGTHTIRHKSPIVIFGGFLYGQAKYETYGFTTGMRIAKVNALCVKTPTVEGDGIDNDCDGKIDEEMCTPENQNKDDDGDGRINEDCAKPYPIDGMWGTWSSYGPCSVTCQSSSKKVSGTKTRSRTCSNPAPAYKGKQCVGSASEKVSCTPTNACRVMRCYTCSYGKKNSDCSKVEECKNDEGSCETKVRRDKAEIKKSCKKTNECKAKCDKKDQECTLCCTGDLCNKNQGYAEFKTWGQWSSCSKQCGAGKRKRSRECSNADVPCSGDTTEEQDCNKQPCSLPVQMRCYTCSYGKKNSDCTKIETCKKDEESCETKVHREKAEIMKKCVKTKYCKTKCEQKDKECTLCCTGDLCNKDQGYAEFKTWGQWSSCSKQCGGGKRKRSRECSSSNMPCTGDQSEEQDCNPQACSTSVCVRDCKGLKSGDYQSCSTCNGFVKCSNSRLYDFKCPGSTVWDDKSKRCEWTSTTCKSAPAQMRCYTCSYGKKNSDCSKIETCKKDEESCETKVHRDKAEIKKKCVKTKYCKAKCEQKDKECTLCCTGDLCNKDQGYAEFKTWGQWSSCSKQCGGGKRTRSRDCSNGNIPCSGDAREEQDCNNQPCSPPAQMRCYTCSYGKKNSDCTKIETCKKDEESCETKVHRDKAEIKKKCVKTKYCKAKCEQKDKECTLCCTGDLCNKDQGYAEYKTWGQWSSCSKQCGGGKRKRSRECSNADVPCSGDTTEEQDCNKQACSPPAQMRCYTCSYGKKNSDCSKIETCKKDEESCETKVHRDKAEIKKKCVKTKYCKAKCEQKDKECTLCCTGDLCNKDQGYAEFKIWGQWSSCSKQCGGGKRTRSRGCSNSNIPCSGDAREEQDCNNQPCSPPAQMRCYTCSYGKKNSDCTKIETCKKDEESCETKVHRDKAEIKKKCVKTKYCKAKCEQKDKECTLCCTGDLTKTKVRYAEYKTWGQWSSCSKQCGGGKRKRSRECSSSNMPCTGDQSEEQDCNPQACSTSVCVRDCKGLKSGDYQSCSTCNGFVKCSNSRLYDFKCPGSTVWDDKSKRCEWTSTTCKSAPAQMRCYTCSYGKKNSDCTKIETCKKDEESCETKVHRDKAEIKKTCKKTKDCKAKCDQKDKECTICCTGDLCNKDQGYAEFKTWGQWSSCSKQCGGGKRTRSRDCSNSNIPCSGDAREEHDCNNQPCSPPAQMRCYTCSYGKKNSDCTKIETCKKDEESCETKVHRDKAEIKKKCVKTKYCKAKCEQKDKECTLCCTGDLCNKDQGYAEYKTWGQWSSCSKQCGGGKRKRSRECSSSNMPCTGDQSEEQDCNPQACSTSAQMRCYTCSYGKKNSDCTKIETCKKDEESCETKVHRDKAEIKKTCKKTKDCKAKCDQKDKECTICCTGNLCNKDQGYAEFKTWGQWSSCSKQCGGGKRTRSRDCSNSNIPCSGDAREEQDCNNQPCSPPAQMRCYTCSYGKKNSDCTKIETCKKDEESCETKVHRDKAEIKKKCVKTKYCKTKCEQKDKECTLCCTGDLCNKDQGYAEYKTWGQWSSCSKQCGGGKRKRSRECSSSNMPCTGDQSEEQDCNPQACSTSVCVRDCKGLKSGDYQSCSTCNGFVKCSNSRLYDFKCPGSTVWDDKSKRCEWTSTTCKSAPAQMRCYTCSYGKKNSDCTKIETCKKDEESCETKVHRDKAEIKKTCKKTKDCKAKCDQKDKECTICCTGDLCNKDQGYAEFKTWGQWSSCSKQCGGGKRTRSRDCSNSNIPCSGDTREEQDCNNQPCSPPAQMRCYTCSYGKKNSDCTKIETCKKDEESCETKVHRDKAEIKKKCKKTKDCKAKCDQKDKECTICCTGDLCNKNQGYAEFKTWGQWSSCSKQCGGGKRKRNRQCSSSNIPCTGDQSEEQDCNPQACSTSVCVRDCKGLKSGDYQSCSTCNGFVKCSNSRLYDFKCPGSTVWDDKSKRCEWTSTTCKSAPAQMRCYTCSYGKKNSDCTKIETCKKDEESCETKIHRDKAEIKKTCKKTKDCKAKCDQKDKECTICCTGDLCNKNQGYAEFKTWGQWSSCSKQCGGGKRTRSRDCSSGNIPCSGDAREEQDCNNQPCSPPAQMRCYTCSHGKKNSDCTKIETCKKDEQSCETKVHRDKAEIKKTCKKTKDCKAKCDQKDKECTICCTGDLCNKNQGYAEFKTWGQWSSCSKQCGGGKRKRSRECSSSNMPCTGDQSEEQDCNPQACSTSVCVRDCKGLKNGNYQSCSTCKGFVKCSNSRLYTYQCPGSTVWDDKSKRCEWTSTTCKSPPVQMRCYSCSNGKKNSDCTKIETCKKDEETCETKLHRDKAEIKKSCKKTNDCKAKCEKNDKECTICCTGDLCNKNQGYAEFKTWGQWSSCSKQCGGGKRKRSRECPSGNIPCSGDSTEEQDCNKQSCTTPAQMRCYTCSNGKKNSDCTKVETCKKDELSCETKVRRDKGEIKKSCKKSKDCKPKCDKNDKECTMCCTGDLCNKVQGYAEFRSWGSWSSCSKKCGGGIRRRSRVCSSSGNAPCLGDSTEEQDCNKQSCVVTRLTCFSCSYSSSNEACNKQRRAQTCQTGQNKCGTRIDRSSKKVLKTCASTCTPRCDSRSCTFCCDTPNCNEEYGTYGPWSNWEMEKVNNVNILKRKRVCTSMECSGKLTETKACTPALCKPTPTTKPQQFGCYTCSNEKSNDECNRKGGFKTCPSGQDKCGTRVDKRTRKIIKACTKVCKPSCDKTACTYCCSTPGCNNEFGTYGQWSPWKQETRNNVEVLVRKRKCLNDICSGKDEETKACTPTLCTAPAQRCYMCSKAKSNSACTKVETCKKDEESCETKVHRNRYEISKKCTKTKDCRPKCDPNDDSCVTCCKGPFCNKEDGYAKWSIWGPWTTCSKQCGGGLKRRKRACSTTTMPCSGSDIAEVACNTQACTTIAAPVTIPPNSSQFGCYICSHEKDSDTCNKNGIQACPGGQQVCGTRVNRKTKTVMKACTAACKPSCTSQACTFCCSSTGCNKEYGRYGQWSSWKEKKEKGGKKVLVRTRACLTTECSGVSSETKPCTPALCSGYEQKCYVCNKGKKNSDCSKIETCKKDEHTCETRVEKGKTEITKRCRKEKECKPRCDPKDDYCVTCCKGSLCNKDQGYGNYGNWGIWTPCSKRCGGGKQKRFRRCSSSKMPCDGPSTEERACNTASCVQSSECHRCTNAKNNGECNKQRKDTCSAYQSCETKIDRRTKALTKKCTSTSACKTLCHGNSAVCTFCCQGDNCNEGYGEWAPWSAWALKNGKKSRTRTCNTLECSGESFEEEQCTGTSCSGVQNFQCRSCTNARSDAECNFGPLVTCPADQHTCQTRVEKATGLTSKGCASPTSCKAACAAGSQMCIFCCSGSTCNENYGSWGGWGAWSVTGNKGSLMTRKRTCTSILCSGEGVETLPCRGPICSQFRCQVCNNATSNEDCNKQGFQTCGSNDDTCGTSVTRATSRISKGCKPKGGCKPWCDAVSCTFCCNSAYCNDVYGVWQLWTSWKVVLVNNVYKRQRTRNCVTTLCSGDDKEEEACTGASCTSAPTMPAIDGGFTDWSTWSSCSKTCGGGTSERSRTCSQPLPQNGGRNCTGSFSDSKDCNTQSCPVDGSWGVWGPWATCSKSCGGGKQHRERKCDDPTPAHGGTNCTGDTMQLDDCNDILCPLPSSGLYVQKCPTGWFTCKSGGITCIDVSFKCDCANDCDDGSDEEIAYASCTIAQMKNCNSGTDHIKFSWWILLLSLVLGLMTLR